MNYITARHQAYSIIVSVLAFSIAAIFVFKYSYNLPIWDQWELVPYLQKMNAGKLISINELMKPHNEHRIFFPKVIMLCLAYFTHWNVNAEVYFGLFLVTLSYVLLYITLNKTFNSINYFFSAGTGFIVACLLCSVLHFSLNQYENLLWGWQITIFLGIFGTVTSCFLLSRGETLSIINFVGAILLAVIATFSFANGILTWPIGFVLLLLNRKYVADALIKISSWLASCIITTYFYFKDLPPPPKTIIYLKSPTVGDYAEFFFSYLGSPLTKLGVLSRIPSAAVGFVGFAVAIAFIGILLKRGVLLNKHLLFWHALLSYSLLSAASTTVGRIKWGISISLVSRYTSISQYFWIWIFVIGIYLACIYMPSNKFLFSAVIVPYVVLFAYYGRLNFIKAKERVMSMPHFQTVLEHNDIPNHLKEFVFVYPEPLEIIDKNNYLRNNHLSFYYSYIMH